MDAGVVGTFRMSFTNFTTGGKHAFGGEYLELVPLEKNLLHRQIRRPEYAGREMRTPVTLKPVLCGTDICVVQEGNTGSYPHRDVLSRLARVVGAVGAFG